MNHKKELLRSLWVNPKTENPGPSSPETQTANPKPETLNLMPKSLVEGQWRVISVPCRDPAHVVSPGWRRQKSELDHLSLSRLGLCPEVLRT